MMVNLFAKVWISQNNDNGLVFREKCSSKLSWIEECQLLLFSAILWIKTRMENKKSCIPLN